MAKRIALVVVIVAVVASIWYLDSMKAHVGSGTGAGAPQAINVGSSGTESSTVSGSGATSPAASSSSSSSSSSPSSLSAAQAIAAIAAADEKAGDKPAIEIADPTGFVNASSSFRLKDLVGKKVILLDFWTYSCINCIRTLPYLTSWYAKYKDQGLVVVGIHTPEFDFEKDINNVQAATKQYGITYPVVLDSDYGTWSAYGNLYWPHEYLIDIAGYIVHDHVGEGSYDETEGIIQQLLRERATALGASSSSVSSSDVNVKPADLGGIGSPETYFGAARNELLANGARGVAGTQALTLPDSFNENQLYLGGSWNFADQYATNNAAGATVVYHYASGKVYLVASGAATGTVVEVWQDGKPVTASAAGNDVHDGKVVITSSRLYNLISNADGPGDHTLKLIIDSPGLEAFTFTFG
ncbi:MAG TPA: redoxin domain-containing protein [Candidatus Paceibacterota bacterium]|nr:redoxin domain-containing protein [Candidatus Paceibacterota bacterium]